jgi:hypothetical protein
MEAKAQKGGVRPVKFLLEPELADRVDRAVAWGLGGYTDRHQLAAAAIDSYLLDLEHPGEPGVAPRGPNQLALISDIAGARGTGVMPVIVPPLPRGMTTNDDASELRADVMFGLHNRDWPSLWALARLAAQTGSGPMSLAGYMNSVTEEAWHLAEVLGTLDPKLTALLPTNRAKAQSAEEGFRAFAIASLAKRGGTNGLVPVSGPLPLWRAVAFARVGNEMKIGVTDKGWELLANTSGLTPEQPHPKAMAAKFFDHLRRYAAEDWWGFVTLLGKVKDGPERGQLVSDFRMERSDFTESVAATVVAGYVARAREWGLVETKLSESRYKLTEFGLEVLRQDQREKG